MSEGIDRVESGEASDTSFEDDFGDTSPFREDSQCWEEDDEFIEVISEMSELDRAVIKAIDTASETTLSHLLRDNPDYKITTDMFAYALGKLGFAFYNAKHENCFRTVITSISRRDWFEYVNYTDGQGMPLLAHAIRIDSALWKDCAGKKFFGDETICDRFLKMGASLADLDTSGVPILAHCDYESVKHYLDARVRTCHNCVLEFDFRSLLPSRRKVQPETVDVFEILLTIRRLYPLRGFLSHPLVLMFLVFSTRASFRQMKMFFYANLALYLLFYASVLLQVINCYTPVNAWPFLITTTCLLLIREVFQAVISPISYLKNAENYLEVTVITLTFLASTFTDVHNTNQLIVFIFLFSTFDLLFLSCRHLNLIKYVLLFKTVLKTILKLSLLYLVIIIAFALSFNILLTGETQPDAFFANPWISIFKTIIMTTGEYDLDSRGLNNHPFGSHITLLLFVTIVSVILMNLIVGLAVSDIQRLERHSHLSGYLSTVEFLQRAQRVIMNPKARWLFRLLGRVNASLDFVETITATNQSYCEILPIQLYSETHRLLSELTIEDDGQELRDEVSRLTKLLEDVERMMDAKT